jgi:hypothetical protein
VASLKSVFPGSAFEPFTRQSFGQFLATLSNPGKSLLVLDIGTLTLSGVNKYNDSVVEYRYINSTTGHLQSVLFSYNEKIS